MRRIKVVYIRLSGDPNSIAQHVLNNIEGCVNILQDHNVAMLDEEGSHTLSPFHRNEAPSEKGGEELRP